VTARGVGPKDDTGIGIVGKNVGLLGKGDISIDKTACLILAGEFKVLKVSWRIPELLAVFRIETVTATSIVVALIAVFIETNSLSKSYIVRCC
jgi:hypothetical protein